MKHKQLGLKVFLLVLILINGGVDYTYAQNDIPVQVTGVVADEEGLPLPGVNVTEKGSQNGAVTDLNGRYSISVPSDAVLVFSFLGFESQEINVQGRQEIDVSLREGEEALEEVLLVGYREMKRENITASISNVSSEDIEMVKASTVSGMLAGKIPGLSFRHPDGRPGTWGMLEIRNMGEALYVIDGIQQDYGAFANLSPNDIADITIMKDASAAVYGVRAANGVVLVTTKTGNLGERNTLNIDAYYGVQNWTRFPETLNAYEWMYGRAEAEMNRMNPGTNITPEELEKWRQGTEEGYQSFDWYDFVVTGNAPQTSININTRGGTENTHYYVSYTDLNQDAVFGNGEFTFNRKNLQSNIGATISDRLKVGLQINGRIEEFSQPGTFGGDKYWLPRFAIFANRPTERAYANDNPSYIRHNHNIEANWAMHNKETLGYSGNVNHVIQTNFNAEYDLPVKGLTASGKYSYYFAENEGNIHEKTYQVYTYFPEEDEYVQTAGSTNTYRNRSIWKITNQVMQAQLNYDATFGETHDLGATLVTERIERRTRHRSQHAVPIDHLTLFDFSRMTGNGFADTDAEEARVGYVGQLNYDFDDRFFLNLTARYDGSWKFAPEERWGFFPSASAGWRITEEPFFRSLISEDVLSSLKFRASYGKMGDDNVGIGAFDHVPGYNYGTSTVIMNGEVVTGIRDRGLPITNITWFEVNMFDVGADFSLFNGKVTGAVDYFYRKRTGLRGRKWDVLLPVELGYSLPDENVNSDAQMGMDGAINYNDNIGDLNFRIGGNAMFSRSKFLESYKPRWGNSYEHYRTSGENRWNNIFWGYKTIGQFQSQEEINNYPVNIDGQGNRSLLPGDLIYEDVNDDGRIDDHDVRPIGYPSDRIPLLTFGFSLSLDYKGFDFTADFAGGGMYSLNQQWELRYAYQGTGNTAKYMYDDRWHREDPFDINSEWVPGNYPALRYNEGGHSNYNRNSDFWLTNVWFLRAKTIELGYSLNDSLLDHINLQRARIYINTFNLFSLDNVSKFGIDPEISEGNGLAYPQTKNISLGVNLSF